MSDRSIRNRKRRRWGWLIGLPVIILLTSASAYAYYTHRRERNTQKLLADAREAMAGGDWEEAVASYNLYLRRNPGDSAALSAYGEALLKRLTETPEVLGETLRVMRRVILAQPSDPAPLSRLTEIYLQIGEFSQAQELSRQWAALAPDSTDAVAALVRANHGLRKDAEAVKLLIDHLQRRPAEARLYPMLVELLNDSLSRPDEAAFWLGKALEVASDAADVQLAAFFFHQRGGREGDAQAHLQKALELAPADARVLTAAASYYLDRGDLAQADRLLQRAEAAAPKHRAVLAARTAWAVRNGSPGPLAATADQLAAMASSDDLDLIARAAELYLRAGRMDRADECIEKLAAASRTSEPVLAWLDTLRGARHLLAGQPYAAVPHLDKALRRQPEGLWAAELLAAAYVKTGAPDEAADLYRRILQSTPHLAAARLALARLELRQRNWAEARRHVALVVEGPDAPSRQVQLIRTICDLRETPSGAEKARDELRQMAATPPSDPAEIDLLAQALVLSGQTPASLELLLSLPGDANSIAWLGGELGRLLLSERQTAAATEFAARWTARFPQAPEGHALRVLALAADGRLPEAKAIVESALLQGPAQGKLWELLADQFALADDGEETLEALRKARAVLPQDIGVRHKLIRRMNSAAEAMPLVDEIRGIEGPEGVQWRFERAWILMRHDRAASAAQAVDLLKQCLAVRPGWVSARVLLGAAQEARSAWAEAAEAYRTAIVQDPRLATDEVAVRLVETLKRLGRFAEADAALTPLVAALPDSPEVLRLEMEKQLRNRSVTSAAAVAERILDLSGDDATWAAVAADLHLRAGDAASAERIAREALKTHPESASLITSLARSMIAQDRSADAEALVRQFAESRNEGVAYVLLAQVLVFMRQDAAAETAMTEALRKSPADASVVAAAADFWGSRGDREKQVAFARKAVELRGEDPTQSMTLARLLATGGVASERAEAEAIVKLTLAAQQNHVEAHLLAAELTATGRPADYAAAERHARQALLVDPRSAEAHKTLAAVQGRSGQVAAAEQTVSAALAVAPDDPELLLTAIQLQCHRGEYDQALVSLRQLLRIRPRLPDALRLFAAASRFAGQIDQGIAYIEQQALPEHWTALELVLLAKLNEGKGDLARASELFVKAYERDRRSAEVFQEYLHFLSRRSALDQVYTLASQRRVEMAQDLDSVAIAAELLCAAGGDSALRQTALGWLGEIASAHPDRAADARYRSGLCHYQAGDLKSAESMLSNASAMEPNSPRPVNALAWLYCEDLRQPEKALSLIEAYLSRGGTVTPELLDTHATVLLRLKRPDAAKEKLIAVLDLAGQTSTYTAANYHLGLALIELGALEEGRSYLRQALKLQERVGGLSEADQKEARRRLAEDDAPAAG